MVKMNFKPSKMQLRVAAAAMVLISIAVIAASVFLPVNSDMPVPSDARSKTSAPASTAPAANSVDFSDVLDVELRRPLVDAHPAVPSKLSASDPLFGLKLTGTIMDPMHPYAVFTDSTGKTALRSIGDRMGSAALLAINSDSVTLQVNGRPTVLHVVKPTSIGTITK
jgi:type II secretory pathway component PulC